MPNIVYIAVSLDGFIATPDGGIGWLNEIPNPDNSDFGFSEFMAGIDALVMGRKTFEKVLEFEKWPYTKPVFVLSRRLKVVPPGLEDRAQFMSGKIKDVVDTLNAKGFGNLYVDGGQTIQSFLKQNLIDEMIITWISVILGDGVPLFGKTGVKTKFELIENQMLSSSMVVQHYKLKR